METIGLPIRVFAIDTLCSGTWGRVGYRALFQGNDAGAVGYHPSAVLFLAYFAWCPRWVGILVET